MDEIFDCWLFLLMIFILCCADQHLQRYPCWKSLHAKSYGFITQWYAWFLFILIGSFSRAVFNYIQFDVLKHGWFTEIKLKKAVALKKMIRLDLEHTPVLLYVSRCGPFVGAFAALLLAYHVGLLTLSAKSWKPTLRGQLILVIIATPGVFTFMAVKAQMRLWELMTESYASPKSPLTNHTATQAAATLYGMTEAQLTFASAVQYISVICFAVLCFQFFSIKDLKNKVSKKFLSTRDGVLQGDDKAWFANGSHDDIDVTSELNELIKANGLVDISGGRPLDEVLKAEGCDIPDASFFDLLLGRRMLKIKKGKYDAEFPINRGIFLRCCRSRQTDLSSSMEHGVSDYATTMKRSGLLGVYAYTLLGIVDGITKTIIYWKEQDRDLHVRQKFQGYEQNFEQHFKPALLLAMALCIINMIDICSLRDIQQKKALGRRASLKFMALRLLLICSQVQPLVLKMLTESDSDISNNVSDSNVTTSMQKNIRSVLCGSNITHDCGVNYEDFKMPADAPGSISWLWPVLLVLYNRKMSKYQSQLWNASLLCFECLALTVLNLWSWRVLPSEDESVDFSIVQAPSLSPPPSFSKPSNFLSFGSTHGAAARERQQDATDLSAALL